MISNPKMVAVAVFTVITAVAAHVQPGRRAARDDATAKFMIDAERQWAESDCAHSRIA